MAIPTPIVRELDQNGYLRTMAIDLSDNAEDRASIIEVLRSKLYSDKILAVIREYSCNAADSHVEAGFPTTPIKITLPTQLFPEFKIRDYGTGLTPDEIEKVYIKYGRSTKRNTNGQTGQLGLGCKSGFAYGDNFVVVSYKDGIKTTYNLTISGVCTVFATERMTSEDKNGIEICIPVNPSDIVEFQNKAMNFFKYWSVCPEITGGDTYRLQSLRDELAIKPIFFDTTWELRSTSSRYSYQNEGIAVMGNIPYPLNWDIVYDKLRIVNTDTDRVLYDFIKRNRAILRFDIGQLDFSASRESLEYTRKTCDAVLSKLKDIATSIFRLINEKIKSASSYWEAMVVYNKIFGKIEGELFQADINILEKSYQGKFSWGGTPLLSGSINNLNRWDSVLGYSDTGIWKDSMGNSLGSKNVVLTTYTLTDKNTGKNKLRKADSFYNNSILASPNKAILINDLEKPKLTKSVIKYVFTQFTAIQPNVIYYLRFKDTVQMNDFISKNKIESAPIVYVSKIIGKVKEWLKSTNTPRIKGTSLIRDPQNIRVIPVKDYTNQHGYMDKVDWQHRSVDIRNQTGFFIGIEGTSAVVNGQLVYSLNEIAKHVYVILNALGDKTDVIHGITLSKQNSKWFTASVKNGQWTNICKYFKSKEKEINDKLSKDNDIARKYFANEYSKSNIGINFAEKILPLLKNKNGAMYKACEKISSSFRTNTNLGNAMEYFGLKVEESKKCNIDFNSLFDNVYKAYPLLNDIAFCDTIKSNEKTKVIRNEYLDSVSSYVNAMDSIKTV